MLAAKAKRKWLLKTVKVGCCQIFIVQTTLCEHQGRVQEHFDVICNGFISLPFCYFFKL